MNASARDPFTLADEHHANYVPPTANFARINNRLDFVSILQTVATECAHISESKGFMPDEKTPQELVQRFFATRPKEEWTSPQALLQLIEDARASMPKNTAQMLALVHSEVSEMLEAERSDPLPMSTKMPEFTEQEEEAADVLIRLLHFCKYRKLRLGEATLAKMEVNRLRPFKHGKRY